MATFAYIETAGVTNEWLRAAAGAHRLCAGYPDGVPETWRTPSACAGDATECRVEWHETRGKHFMDETPKRPGLRDMVLKYGPVLVVENSEGVKIYPENWGGAGGGAAYPEHELDPAALLGPVAEPVDWPERDAAGDEEC